jgi:hypothetical protein
VAIVLLSGTAIVTAWTTRSRTASEQPGAGVSMLPNVVHDGLRAATRAVAAAGFTSRDWPSSGGAIFGRNVCHPAVVEAQRPAPGLANRSTTVVTLLVGPGNVRCATSVPRGDGTVVGVLEFSSPMPSTAAYWPRPGRVIASSHVRLTGVLHVARVGPTGLFRLSLRPGEWHLVGFTPHYVDGNNGKPAECAGGDVRITAATTVRADVVCVGL